MIADILKEVEYILGNKSSGYAVVQGENFITQILVEPGESQFFIANQLNAAEFEKQGTPLEEVVEMLEDEGVSSDTLVTKAIQKNSHGRICESCSLVILKSDNSVLQLSRSKGSALERSYNPSTVLGREVMVNLLNLLKLARQVYTKPPEAAKVDGNIQPRKLSAIERALNRKWQSGSALNSEGRKF